MNSLPSSLSHSPIDEHVSWFYLLAVGNNASMQIYVQVFGWAYTFVSLVLFIFLTYEGVELLNIWAMKIFFL